MGLDLVDIYYITVGLAAGTQFAKKNIANGVGAQVNLETGVITIVMAKNFNWKQHILEPLSMGMMLGLNTGIGIATEEEERGPIG